MDHAFNERSLKRLMALLASLLADANISLEDAVNALSLGYADAAAERQNRPGDRDAASATEAEKHFLADMINYWSSMPKFANDLGKPMALPRTGQDASLKSLFEFTIATVAFHNQVFDFDASIQRLIDHGSMVQNDDSLFELKTAYFSSNSTRSSTAPLLLGYVMEFLHTAVHNRQFGGGTGRFQRTASAVAFPAASEAKLNQLVDDHGMDLLKLVDAFIMKESNAAANQNDDKRRVGTGVYIFVEDSDSIDD